MLISLTIINDFNYQENHVNNIYNTLYIDNNNRNSDFGESKLSHNPITNPINNVNYNKYLNFNQTYSTPYQPQNINNNNNTMNNNNTNILPNQNNYNYSYNINQQEPLIQNQPPLNNNNNNNTYPSSITPLPQDMQYNTNNDYNRGNINNTNNYINYSNPYPSQYNPQVLQPSIQPTTTSQPQINPYQQRNITPSGTTLRQAASNFLN